MNAITDDEFVGRWRRRCGCQVEVGSDSCIGTNVVEGTGDDRRTITCSSPSGQN